MKLLVIYLLHVTILFISAVSPAAAQIDVWVWVCDDSYGNYTSNSTYKSNLDGLLSNITTIDNPYGFYNFSAGQDSDEVDVIALCKGDVVNFTECHACLSVLKSNLTGSCPTQRVAIGWAAECMLRYSTPNILGVWEYQPLQHLGTEVDAGGDVGHFANVVEDLLISLPNKTADGDSRLKFATGEANVNASHKVYGLMQCTPDLMASDCLGCLYWGMYYVLRPDSWQTGLRVLQPSCSIRYELQKFYSGSPSSPDRSGKGGVNPKIVVLVAILFLFVIFLIWVFLRARESNEKMKKAITFKLLEMNHNFSSIKGATQNFSKDNQLGCGGFGRVCEKLIQT